MINFRSLKGFLSCTQATSKGELRAPPTGSHNEIGEGGGSPLNRDMVRRPTKKKRILEHAMKMETFESRSLICLHT